MSGGRKIGSAEHSYTEVGELWESRASGLGPQTALIDLRWA
jgi:hypothetical protein